MTTPWDGARNLLDLGGLPLADGGVTAPGRVWRSAAPEWLTAQGWEDARAAGLTRVVDLRNQPERGRRDHHPVLETEPEVDVVHAPTENPDDADYLAECGEWLDRPQAWTPTMQRFPALVAAALTAVAEAPGPVLVHCAGGRDRTGLVSAMLLALAGAGPEVVAADYERGWRGAGSWAGHALGYDPGSRAWVETVEEASGEAELDAQVAERVPVVHEWYAVTDVAGYLADAGVDDPLLERLRGLLR